MLLENLDKLVEDANKAFDNAESYLQDHKHLFLPFRVVDKIKLIENRRDIDGITEIADAFERAQMWAFKQWLKANIKGYKVEVSCGFLSLVPDDYVGDDFSWKDLITHLQTVSNNKMPLWVVNGRVIPAKDFTMQLIKDDFNWRICGDCVTTDGVYLTSLELDLLGFSLFTEDIEYYCNEAEEAVDYAKELLENQDKYFAEYLPMYIDSVEIPLF